MKPVINNFQKLRKSFKQKKSKCMHTLKGLARNWKYNFKIGNTKIKIEKSEKI